jgi:hypothetical protein
MVQFAREMVFEQRQPAWPDDALIAVDPKEYLRRRLHSEARC